MRRLFILLGIISFLSCSALDRQDRKYVLWVNSSLSSCVGKAPSKCLQVQKSDTLDPHAWESFHAPILGFEFEEGYFYKIVVQERELDNAELLDETPSLEYTLVEILEKRHDLRFRINGGWELRQLDEQDLAEQAEAGQVPRLEIHIGDMRYMGNDGCNNFTGGIIELDEDDIRFGVAAGTRMMCESMEIPDRFNASIPGIRSWEIRENRLHLFNAEGKEVLQLVKFD